MAFPALLKTGPFAPSAYDGVVSKEIEITSEKSIFVPGLTKLAALFLDRNLEHEMEVVRNMPFLDPGREVQYRPVTFPALHVEYSSEGATIYRSQHCHDGTWQVGMTVHVFGEYSDIQPETLEAAPKSSSKKPK